MFEPIAISVDQQAKTSALVRDKRTNKTVSIRGHISTLPMFHARRPLSFIPVAILIRKNSGSAQDAAYKGSVVAGTIVEGQHTTAARSP